MSQFVSYLHGTKPAAVGCLLCNLCSALLQHSSYLSLPCIAHHVWHVNLQANNSTTTSKVVVAITSIVYCRRERKPWKESSLDYHFNPYKWVICLISCLTNCITVWLIALFLISQLESWSLHPWKLFNGLNYASLKNAKTLCFHHLLNRPKPYPLKHYCP